MNEQALSLLTNASQELGLVLNQQQLLQLLQYRDLLLKWNKTFSLTAVTSAHEMLIQHIIDGLSIVAYFAKFNSILDIGSGMGVPGVILAICYPQAAVTVLDSNSKKTAFLTQVRIELKLTNLQVVTRRVEAYQPPYLFQAITSRAFASLDLFAQLAKPHLASEGVLLAMKSSLGLDEAKTVKGFASEALPLVVPGLPAKRYLIKMVAA